MPIRGIEQVRSNYRRTINKIAKGTTQKAVFAVLREGAGMAQLMTPVDTSNLINSQYAPVIQVMRGKVSGRVGYTASYAFWVHNASGKLKGQPRKGKGRVGAYWDPAGEPQFLYKGFEEIKPNISRILKAVYRAGNP